jgi:hypothetical protein
LRDREDFDGPAIHQSRRQESNMSALNGDKSRFNRVRKQKIARRKRNRELLNSAAIQPKSVAPAAPAKPRSVPA